MRGHELAVEARVVAEVRLGMGLMGSGLEFGVGVWGLEYGCWSLGFGFGVWGLELGLRVWISRFRVESRPELNEHEDTRSNRGLELSFQKLGQRFQSNTDRE